MNNAELSKHLVSQWELPDDNLPDLKGSFIPIEDCDVRSDGTIMVPIKIKAPQPKPDITSDK